MLRAGEAREKKWSETFLRVAQPKQESRLLQSPADVPPIHARQHGALVPKPRAKDFLWPFSISSFLEANMSATSQEFEGVTVVDHPLIRVKLSKIRSVTTPSEDFRRELRELATLMTYEVARDFETL